MIIGLHPLSRGSVHISSADPLFPPSIDPRYFSNPADLEIMVSAVKFVRKLMRTEPYASAGCKMYDPPEKSAVSNEDLSDDEIRDWCRTRVISIFHPIGTAAMMPKEDGGVVDSSLKVYGTKNLRVVRIFSFPKAVCVFDQSLCRSTHLLFPWYIFISPSHLWFHRSQPSFCPSGNVDTSSSCRVRYR